MEAVLKKLQIKPDMTVAVLRAPAELAPMLEAWGGDVTLKTRQAKSNDAVVVFVRSCAEIAELAPKVAAKVQGDALLWWAYPKKSSKTYSSDIGRDDSWEPLGKAGFEGVRQIAIDADWSALRFRRVEHIKTMKRESKRAITAAGKARTRGAR